MGKNKKTKSLFSLLMEHSKINYTELSLKTKINKSLLMMWGKGYEIPEEHIEVIANIFKINPKLLYSNFDVNKMHDIIEKLRKNISDEQYKNFTSEPYNFLVAHDVKDYLTKEENDYLVLNVENLKSIEDKINIHGFVKCHHNEPCSIRWCNNKYYKQGYCRKHYLEVQKFGYIKSEDPYHNAIITNLSKWTAQLELSNKVSAIIDLEDIKKVKGYKWCLNKSGICYSPRRYKTLAACILNKDDNSTIYYKNGNKLDCRKSNLTLNVKYGSLGLNKIIEDEGEGIAYISLSDDIKDDKQAIIDLEDVKKVEKYRWCINKNGICYTPVNSKNLSTYILDIKSKVVYYKNGDKLDCRKCNLVV